MQHYMMCQTETAVIQIKRNFPEERTLLPASVQPLFGSIVFFFKILFHIQSRIAQTMPFSFLTALSLQKMSGSMSVFSTNVEVELKVMAGNILN